MSETYNRYGVRKEKLGIRDLRYNNRHRDYGKTLRMYDVDFVEYDIKTNEPVAMVETKHGNQKVIDFNDPEVKCTLRLAERAQVPYFIVVYYPTGPDLIDPNLINKFGDYWQFYVIPVNQLAKKKLPGPMQMTEKLYVQFLYFIRNEKMPDNLLLDDVKLTVPLPEIK